MAIPIKSNNKEMAKNCGRDHLRAAERRECVHQILCVGACVARTTLLRRLP